MLSRTMNGTLTHNGSRLCVVPMLKLTQNLIKGTKDGKFRKI